MYQSIIYIIFVGFYNFCSERLVEGKENSDQDTTDSEISLTDEPLLEKQVIYEHC
jgi:hypothetical protein